MYARPLQRRLPLSLVILSLIALPGLANDDCRDALPIHCGDMVSGDTTGATTDGAWPCAAGGSDIWYSFTAADPLAILDLCTSSYDTAVMLLDGCNGVVLGCNDDFCGLQSTLTVTGLTVGNTYLIAVGGFGGERGSFSVTLTCGSPSLCALAQPGDFEENEPFGGCATDYVDAFNGGCESDPPVFSPIHCGDSIHGRSGTFTSGEFGDRDTDAWRMTVSARQRITWTVTAEFPATIGFYGPTCPIVFVPNSTVSGPACVPLTTSADLRPGDYVAFIMPTQFAGVPCGVQYRASLTCEVCPGDFNYDAARDIEDLSILLSEFGAGNGQFAGDFDGDLDVDLSDLAQMLALFGLPC